MRVLASFALAAALCGLTVAQGQAQTLQAGHPLVMGQMTVIPILGNDDESALEMLSLSDAYKKGLVGIRDTAQATVIVKNNAKQPLLLLAGELIVGGHQDQIIEQDYVVMPEQTTVVNVYCVEAGRSAGMSSLFASTGMLVPDWIRRTAFEGALRVINYYTAQNRIWAQVDEINSAHGLPAGSGSSIGRTLLGDGFSKDVEGIAVKLAGVEDSPRTIGMLVTINGQIYSTDLFSSHKNFEEFRPLLLHLYALDSYLSAASGKAAELGSEELQAYLNAIATPPRSQTNSNGTTSWYRPATNSLLGMESGLDKRRGYLHGVYFPN